MGLYTYESGIGASQLVHSTELVRASFGEFLEIVYDKLNDAKV
jgi:hypothetical protein